MLKAARKGRINSWAVYFVLFQLNERIRSVHPAHSLVQYLGIDQQGTHTTGSFDWTFKEISDRNSLPSLEINESLWLNYRLFFLMTLNSIKRRISVLTLFQKDEQ
mgnify:CR=1 FL=1